MMKKMACILITLNFLFSVRLFPGEKISLKNGEDYLEKLIENGVYFKNITDADYEDGLLYLLDIELGRVFVIDFESGKMKRTLFNRGQGPFELMKPVSIKVKNKKVFVLDKGFNGIKITDLQGNPLKECKTKSMVGSRNIDVTDKDEIYIGEFNSAAKTYVSVYHINGEKKRSLIKIGSDADLPLQRIHYKIRLDGEGNVIILFNVLKELKKFKTTGELIWESKIENRILEQAPKSKVEISKKGTMHTKIFVYHIETTRNRILVGSAAGISVLDDRGKLIREITLEPISFVFLFKITGNKIVNIFPAGRRIESYDIKEEFK